MSTQDDPYVVCVDVGMFRNVGWASSDVADAADPRRGRVGGYEDLASEMQNIAVLLGKGRLVALGFEAPVWTPARQCIKALTKGRGGYELEIKRPWSAAAGTCVLAAGLALMPWCFREIKKWNLQVNGTVRVDRFVPKRSSLLIWEAFVSGNGRGVDHQDDAQLACKEFVKRWPNLTSDIPGEDCINHAVSGALTSGISIELDEMNCPAVVVAVRSKP